MTKTWAQLSPRTREQVSAFLAESPTGQKIAEQTGDDKDMAVWFVALEQTCLQSYGVSHLDLADRAWPDDYEGGLSPRQALNAAVQAEGLV